MLSGRRIVVLSGAGLSTHSGIPDYRGEGTRRRARNPMQFRAFVDSPAVHRRYWARSFLGWPTIATAKANAGHLALAELERAGHVVGAITQNVDGLHQQAGSDSVVELHGSLSTVRCLDCCVSESRSIFQERLRFANPDGLEEDILLAPDGDAEVEAERIAGFVVPGCLACGGPLKPSVVFFGESVPVPTVRAANALMDTANALLVVGSSLTVFSGLRFVREAGRRSWPIAIVNRGQTRGDSLATLTLDGDVIHVLPALLRSLRGTAPAPMPV
jgi:NAD-dependent deacetylase sirtuin 4